MTLESQKYFPAIEKPTQKENQSHGHHRNQHGPEVAEPCRNWTPSQPGGELREREELPDEINRDRIHPNPYEWLRPLLEFPDVDHLIKNRQKQTTVPSRDQHVR